MKKVSTTICIVMCVLLICILFSGCDSISNNRKLQIWHKVSTVEDLFAMKSGKCYKLQNDIDLQGAEWTPLFVKGFDGNGHKVSNATILTTGTDNWSDYVGLIGRSTWFDNVTIDNFTIIINKRQKNNLTYVSFGVGWANEVTNVTVSNSSCISGIGGNFGGVVGRAAGIIDNCQAINNNYVGNGKSAFGGIVSEGMNGVAISNCLVKQFKASADVAGGIVYSLTNGKETSKIENCSVVDSELTAGIVAGIAIGSANGYISGCNVENNTLTVSKEVSGILNTSTTNTGSISDCLVKDNTFTCTASGGYFAGVAIHLSVPIHSTLAINNEMKTKDAASHSAGFVWEYKSLCYVTNCGVYYGISQGLYYQFSPQTEQILDCYLSEGRGDNNFDILTYDEWRNPEILREKFKITSEVWNLVDGELPSFK